MKYLPLVAVLIGVAFLTYRWKQVSAFYDTVADRAALHLALGEIDNAQTYADYLEKVGAGSRSTFLKNRIADFRKSIETIETRIAPYIEQGDYESALSIVNRSDVEDAAREYLRAKVYDAWGWIIAGANPSGSIEVYAIRPDGSQAWRLTFNDYEELNPYVDVTGRILAYSRSEEGKLHVKLFDLASGVESDPGLKAGVSVDPCLNPGGDGLVYTAIMNDYCYLYAFRFSDHEQNKLTRGAIASNCDISPDGSLIIYEGLPDGIPRSPAQIMLMNADGSNITALTTFESGGSRDPVFAPDGTTFAFRRNDDIWLGSLDGSPPRAISDPAVDERQPAFSPDGRYIVYIASIEGRSVLVRQDLRNGDRFFFPHFARAAQQPRWIRTIVLPPNARKIEVKAIVNER